VVAAVGAVGKVRVPLVRLLLRAARSDARDAGWQRRACTPAGAPLPADEVLVVDAGGGVASLLSGGVPRFVARVARHFPARRNVLPASPGRGRRPAYGERGRPLPRTPKGRTIAASPPEATAQGGALGGPARPRSGTPWGAPRRSRVPRRFGVR